MQGDEGVIKLKDPQGLTNFIAVVLKMEKSAFCQIVSQVSEGEKQVGVQKSKEGTRTSRNNSFG